MAKFDPRVKVPRANMFGGRKHDLQLRSVLPYGTSCMCVCVCVCPLQIFSPPNMVSA